MTKKIIALKLKCPECDTELDYICDVKKWESSKSNREAISVRMCSCKHKFDITKDLALKNIFLKEEVNET